MDQILSVVRIDGAVDHIGEASQQIQGEKGWRKRRAEQQPDARQYAYACDKV